MDLYKNQDSIVHTLTQVNERKLLFNKNHENKFQIIDKNILKHYYPCSCQTPATKNNKYRVMNMRTTTVT